jgi:hypothetical protein
MCDLTELEYLSANTAPVLAELWDNEDDAIYDEDDTHRDG